MRMNKSQVIKVAQMVKSGKGFKEIRGSIGTVNLDDLKTVYVAAYQACHGKAHNFS